MRKYLLAATAVAVLSAPAFAAANGPYVGVEGGATLPQSTDLDVILNNTSTTPTTTTSYNNGYNVDYKTGWNVDAIAGYKLGLLRLEVEGGYQRATVKNATASSTLLGDVSTASNTTATVSDLGIGSRIGVKYVTANALLDGDFGGGFGGYAGGGVGRAWASFSGDKDSAMALTGIAGVRYALSPNVDAGLKYQYLRTGKLAFNDAFAVDGTNFTSTAKGRYVSHSLLASLVYNFNAPTAAAPIPAAAPAPPPPPPEVAPATQTCPDGSVILATSTCPAPPPPPPPPPAQRGERGR
ncbi:MAG: outer membrane beta-barrel protein [Sphingomicrobium sp.]